MRFIIFFLFTPTLFADSPDFLVYRPRTLRPEAIESEILKAVPSAHVGSFPGQNGVVISGDEETLRKIARLIRYLDRPGQIVELEIGMGGMNNTQDGTIGLGVSRGNQSIPSEFRQVGGYSRDNSSQRLICMPGKPAELFIGETQFRDAGPFQPPIQVQAGKRIVVDNLRVIENGAEFDIGVENTVPGSGPVVSSGTRVRTTVRLSIGETATVASNDGDSDSNGSLFDGMDDKNGGYARRRRNNRRAISTGSISVRLRSIR